MQLNEKYLIDRFIPQNSLTLMLAPVDAGIAVVAIDLMLHVAEGRPWMGRAVRRGCVISYGDKGPGYDPIHEAWWLHHQLTRLPNTYVSEPELDLENSGCVERVCGDALATAERTGEPVRLIGIDAFGSPCIRAENFARGISTVVHHLEQIRAKTGAAVMLLRHKSWGNKHSTLRVAADVVLSLTTLETRNRSESHKKLTILDSRDEPIFFKLKFKVKLESVPGRFSTVVEDAHAETPLWSRG
jgi:hypothetical protein